MIVTIVEIHVKPEHIEAFVAATRANHEKSIQEPGNMRFDVLQGKADPARFTLYEAYESETAAAAHKETSHYARWRDEVAPFMAAPRVGTAYRVIAPSARSRW